MPDRIQQLLEWSAAKPKFKEAEDKACAELMASMRASQALTVGNKKGDGIVSLVEGGLTATVVDQEMVEAFCVAEGDSIADTSIVDHGEAVAVLRKYAPELLETRDVAPGWATQNALKRAEAGENIPGVAVKDKAPYLAVRPSAVCKERVQGLLQGGLPQIGGAE